MSVEIVEDLSGQTIKGYELRRQIGQGRFGMVYQASQAQVGREVAIKVIQPEFANHPEFIRSFETEAQLVARLEHIHIVPLYDYWREPDRAFLVMRLLRDGSVRDSLMRRGPWPVAAVSRMLDQVAGALAMAHRKGILHRDLKPDNILLDEDGNSLLTDFGIAVTVMQSKLMAQRRVLVGTPAYMAPELFLGEPASAQSDIYSMGVLLYEVLTNTRPFPDDTTEQAMRHHVSSPMPSLRSAGQPLSAELDLVLWRAAAKSPQARYDTMIDLATAFRSAAMLDDGLGHFSPSDLLEALPGTGEQVQGVTTLIVETPPQPDNPYKGLRSFEQADAADFFGREALVDQLLGHLRSPGPRQRFLALVGPSGSGKSSVVKAGLIPALRMGGLPGSENWFIAEMVPGHEPFRALEAALQSVSINPVPEMLDQLRADRAGLAAVVGRILPQDDQTQLFLFIDQFEELFTQTESEAERKDFLDSLCTAVTETPGRLHVVTTLRADFYDRPLLYEGFGALVRECTEVILPLTIQELQAAIKNPAERMSMVVEPELVAAIITDVSQQPGALPLLQYALTEVFERRFGRYLTLKSYTTIGGITAALARRAEEVYDALPADRQDLARQLFLRLVSLDEEAEATRRRLNWSALVTLSDDSRVIEDIRDTFVKYRLLTMDRDPKTREPTVEIAHEALLREWDRLAEWLDANREDVQMQRRLQAVAGEWQNAGKDSGYLLTSTRLIQFEEWAASANLQLTQDEREFLAASVSERMAQHAVEEARLAREKMLERRTRRWLIGIVLVLAIATLVALLLARYASHQEDAAQNRLLQLRLLSRTDQANRALDDSNPELAMALAFTILDESKDFPVQTQQMLYRAAYMPGARLVFDKHEAPVLSVAISPDGKLVASSSGRLTPMEEKIDWGVRLWDPATGEEIRRLDESVGGHTDTVAGLAFSPDGKMLATSAIDQTIILWDVASGTVIRRLEGHEDWVARVAFSPDGQTLLSGSGNFLFSILPLPTFIPKDTSVRLWDVATGQEIRRFGGEDGGHEDPVMSLAFSADGRFAASGDANGTIIVWDVATGEEIRRIGSPGHWVPSLAFTLDGSAILAAQGTPSIGGTGATSTVMVMWDAETGEKIREFAGHTNVVTALALSPDGRTVLTGSADMGLRLWDVATGAELRRFTGHSNWVFGVAISPDGRWAVSGSTDTTARVWDLEPGNLIRRFDPAETIDIQAVDLSVDGRLALSGHKDGRVMLWDAETGQVIRTFGADEAAHTSAVYGVALSPDAKLAATGDLDGRVIVWDTASGTELRRLEGHTSPVLSIAFSPDQKYIATASGEPQGTDPGEDNTVRLWEVATGAEVRRFEGHQGAVWCVAFNADGDRLVSSSGALMTSGEHNIRLWDVNTGAELKRFEGHADLIASVIFSPDGNYVLSGSDDNTARLWSIQTGQEVRRFEGHEGFINTALFDSDGRTIITGSDDNTIRFWNAGTGEELYRIGDQNDTILDMAISADGRRLLALAANNDLRLWRVDRSLDELTAWIAANRYTRELTDPERALYHVDGPGGD